MKDTVQQNIRNYQEAVRAVKEHCMCVDFEERRDEFFVKYPVGFSVNGATASKHVGKARVLKILIKHMELTWQRGY